MRIFVISAYCSRLAPRDVVSRFRRLVHFHPPFSLFLRGEKEKTGRGRSKREKDADKIGGKFWLDGTDNEKSITDLICFSFRCRCCGGRSGWFMFPRPPAAAAAGLGAESSRFGLLVSRSTIQSLAPHLTNALFFWTVNGPFSFLSPEKRKWGVQFWTSHCKWLTCARAARRDHPASARSV